MTSPVRRYLICLLLACAVVARAEVPKLQYKGYTNDFAGVLNPQAVARVDALAAEVERKTKAQIAIVLIKSLDGQPIDDYANTLARRWGIGGKENKGVLLLLAIQRSEERRVGKECRL